MRNNELGLVSNKRFQPPTMEDRPVINPPHREKYNPDGSINSQYCVVGGGVYYDYKTGRATMLFEGREALFPREDGFEPWRSYSAVFAATSTDNWETVAFIDSTGIVSDRNHAKPILRIPGQVNYAPDGQQDPRFTQFASNSILESSLIIVNAIDRKEQRESIEKSRIKHDFSLPIHGATPEIYRLRRKNDQLSFDFLGNFGPKDTYFKNVILHPEPIERNGEWFVLLYGRIFPSIQGFFIPLIQFPEFLNNEQFREDYWTEQLQSSNLRKNTILKPIFYWESKGNPYNNKGQIAGGAPPIKVSYVDQDTKELKDAWLFIYNAVPEFTELNGKYVDRGRVVGVALLDYKNPFVTIARAPQPIIIPRSPLHIAFATGAYVDNEGILHSIYTQDDIRIAMASCPLNAMVEYVSKFTPYGKEKRRRAKIKWKDKNLYV